MRLLTYTNLYPGDDLPRHGIFVEERLRHLVATADVDATVCALRPRSRPYKRSNLVESQRLQVRHGIEVNYVDVPTLPYITNWIDPFLWARASYRSVEQLIRENRADTILDAHFLYPDGVAAVMLGRRLGLPVVMTARGSDVNVKCENPVMRRWILWAAERCDAIITVSGALAERLEAIGIRKDSIHTLRNGVDLEKFKPTSMQTGGQTNDSDGPVLLSVGHLLEGKGHHLVIKALTDLSDATLVIVGEGPDQNALRDLADSIGVSSRVRFLGYVPHERMAEIYSAADCTVLASANEGMPNVILESLACGTRVVATNVGGIGEIVSDPVAGALMAERSSSAVAQSVSKLAEYVPSRQRTRDFARRFAWEPTVRKQVSLYQSILKRKVEHSSESAMAGSE